MTYFTDKVAVITGAGSGTGRLLAHHLGAAGSRLSLADVNAENLGIVAAELHSHGVEVHSCVVDVFDRAAFAACAKDVSAQFGVVHQLYNNAGLSGGSRFLVDTPYDVIDKVLAVNLGGVINGTKEFLPRLITSNDGHLINVSSLNGIIAQPRFAAYA